MAALEQLEPQAKVTKVETHQAALMVEEVAAVKVPRPPTWEAITAQTVELAQNGPHPQAPITPEAAEADRIPAAQPVSAVQVEAVTVRQVLAPVRPAAQRTQVAAVAETTAFPLANRTAVPASL